MSSTSARRRLADYELALVWGAWVELGVSGWQKTHVNWAVDPEPLIIRTAALADTDPRLRDEALDWCIHYHRYVSVVRLRNLLRKQSEATKEAWGPFAATVSKHSGANWPLTAEPLRYQTTGRSTLESMDQPSRVWLRMRAMFGLGARTEILRYFLSGPRRASAAVIADSSGYLKRVIADECDSLQKAGVLRVQTIAGRFLYSLARGEELRHWVGEIASVRPDWSALMAVTSELTSLEEQAETLPHAALAVEAHRTARLLDAYLDVLGIDDRPRLVRPDNHWAVLRDFAENYLGAWAVGDWDPTEESQEATPARPIRRRVAGGPTPVRSRAADSARL